MAWWFGRKAASEPARPIVPAWLSASESEGFARSVIGMSLIVRSTGVAAAYGEAGWEIGKVRASQLIVGGTQVVGSQQAAIASPAGGVTVDSEARAAVGQILLALRTHGLIAEV